MHSSSRSTQQTERWGDGGTLALHVRTYTLPTTTTLLYLLQTSRNFSRRGGIQRGPYYCPHPSKRGLRQAPSPALHLELQVSQLGIVHPQCSRRGYGRDCGPCARPCLHPAPERRRGRAAIIGWGGDGVAWRVVRRPYSAVGTAAATLCSSGSRSLLGCAGQGAVVAGIPVPGWYGRGQLVFVVVESTTDTRRSESKTNESR